MTKTTEENPLERALRIAADEPATRPAFYRLLIESEVFVIGGTPSADPPGGRRTLDVGEKINIQNWQRSDGPPVIPFFTSVVALQRAITEPAGYLGLPARSLFELTRGATLVLNPKLPCGKEFFPNEIEALLTTGVNYAPEQRVTQKETKFLLGQPRESPSRMIGALSAFFAKRSQVKAAFLVLMHDTSKDSKPHLVVGVQVDGMSEQLFREAGAVAADTAPKGEPVDLCRVEAGDKGLSEYFLLNVNPFYKRTLGAKLRSIFGAGRS
jgi:hypothetical protein